MSKHFFLRLLQHLPSPDNHLTAKQKGRGCCHALASWLLTHPVALCALWQGGTQSPRTCESDWLWTQESEPTEESDRVWTQESESTEESDLLWTRESESTEESDLLWTRESESTEESDRVWTQESESTEESDLASHLLRPELLGRALIGPLREEGLLF
jgi:hypothetical protein